MRTSFTFVALVLGSSFLAACTESSTTNNGNNPTVDGGTGAACAASGSGNVTVTISGLPADVKADVSIEGGGTTRPAVSGETFSTTGGTYKVTAKIVTSSDPIVRTAYVATIDQSEVCVRKDAAQNIAVTYAPIASSGKLWHINDTPAQILGYASASLTATGAPAATVAAKAPAGKSIAFDREGNLWAPGATTTDAALSRYPASSLGASGDKTADRTLTFDPGAGCSPNISSIAFASDGSLWITSLCGKKAVHLAATALAATGSPTPDREIAGLDAPEGLAFDKDGNLWIADAGAKTILRFDGANSAPAALVITAQTEGKGELPANQLAFDKDGNLWVGSFTANAVYKLTPADLAGTGPKTLVPSVQISLAVDVLPEGLTFDESGSLWMTLSKGKIGRLGASQLGASSPAGYPITPEVIITSPDIGYSVAPAFFPSAKGTPLYASLP